MAPATGLALSQGLQSLGQTDPAMSETLRQLEQLDALANAGGAGGLLSSQLGQVTPQQVSGAGGMRQVFVMRRLARRKEGARRPARQGN